MNLEKILTRNMLRFGTKNLGQAVTVLQLMEAVGDAPGTISITAPQLEILNQAKSSSTALKN